MIFKKLFLLTCLTLSLFASGVYDSNLLDFQAKVFPKIIISDNDLKSKLLENKVVLTILYEDIDFNTAQNLKENIEKNHKTLKEYSLEVNLLRYDDFESSNISTAYFFLLGKKDDISRISSNLIQNSRLSFAYDDNYLDFGVIFGLKIRQKIDIFLNLQNLKGSEIELQNSIFNVVIIK